VWLLVVALVGLLLVCLVLIGFAIDAAVDHSDWHAMRTLAALVITLCVLAMLACTVGLYGCWRVGRDVREHERKLAAEVQTGLIKARGVVAAPMIRWSTNGARV